MGGCGLQVKSAEPRAFDMGQQMRSGSQWDVITDAGPQESRDSCCTPQSSRRGGPDATPARCQSAQRHGAGGWAVHTAAGALRLLHCCNCGAGRVAVGACTAGSGGCPRQLGRSEWVPGGSPRGWRCGPQHQVQRGLFLDVVVVQGAPILQLLASKDEALLAGRDACAAAASWVAA